LRKGIRKQVESEEGESTIRRARLKSYTREPGVRQMGEKSPGGFFNAECSEGHKLEAFLGGVCTGGGFWRGMALEAVFGGVWHKRQCLEGYGTGGGFWRGTHWKRFLEGYKPEAFLGGHKLEAFHGGAQTRGASWRGTNSRRFLEGHKLEAFLGGVQTQYGCGVEGHPA
jgi:hypothetical protein